MLKQIQYISTLPENYINQNTTAEIICSKDGKTLYVSNRGHDSIAVFSIDIEKGTLTTRDIVDAHGKHPRHFNITPDGNWLLCANRDTDNVTVFRIDKDGIPIYTNTELKLEKTVCIKFL
jgi:6-phosphogluconolactonase